MNEEKEQKPELIGGFLDFLGGFSQSLKRDEEQSVPQTPNPIKDVKSNNQSTQQQKDEH